MPIPKAKFRFNSRSVLLTWLLSYVVVLLFPVLMSFIVYTQSSRMLENEIHEANNSLMEQFRGVMDVQFENMKRLSFELGWNVKVRQLLYSNKYLNYPNDLYYDLYQTTKDLNVYKSSFPQIDLFYIYLTKEKLVLLPDLYRDGTFGYQLLHRNEALSLEQWLTLVESGQSAGFIPSVRVTEDGIPKKTVAYVTAHTLDNDVPTGTNVIMIDQSRVMDAVRKLELFNQGHVAIFNERNEVLFSSMNDSQLSGLRLANLTGPEPSYWNDGDSRYEVSVIQSASSGLKYVTLIPSRIFWEKAQKVRTFTTASILISLIGGSGLTFFFLRKNYLPVRRIVQSIASPTVEGKRGYNEFRFIQEALVRTLEEMDRLRLNAKRQHSIVRAHFIARLLKGRTDGNVPVDESLTAFNMRFDSEDFAVMLLEVEDSDDFMQRLAGDDASEKRKLLHFIVTNIAEELMGHHHRGYVTEMDDLLVCLINFNGNTEQGQLELQRIARELRGFLRAQYHVRLSVSFSGTHRSIQGIPQAYTEALDAMEYKLVMGSNEILSYEELQNQASSEAGGSGYYYPLQTEQQLINCVKAGDFAKASQTLDDILERNFAVHTLPVPIARCLLFDLVGTLVKSVNETGGSADLKLFQQGKRIEKLAACETLAEMRAMLTGLLATVCDYTAARRKLHMEESRQQALEQLAGKVSGFIAERYGDPNLNITMIGQHFELKPAYLSRLYKDQTGEGLLDRINRERITQAKRAIRGGEKSVSDVAGKVGFHDVNAFIRIFKKYEGVTPGTYRESLVPKLD
ncbi:helix-turn-helix domain-containing protein [Paenibacillus hodogayensis]|uniref:Helix-turn-helix domain-containing protein n=1 Tax=Paenibacillus hodogayensis TaxID=279208 RepID=A0ABV5W7N8_9BACL